MILKYAGIVMRILSVGINMLVGLHDAQTGVGSGIGILHEHSIKKTHSTSPAELQPLRTVH